MSSPPGSRATTSPPSTSWAPRCARWCPRARARAPTGSRATATASPRNRSGPVTSTRSADVRVERRITLPCTPEDAWAVLAEWEAQAAWMRDADSVRVISPHRTGVGVRLAVRTRLFGIPAFTDPIEVTAWDPPRSLEITHGGPVRGTGTWTLDARRRRDRVHVDRGRPPGGAARRRCRGVVLPARDALADGSRAGRPPAPDRDLLARRGRCEHQQDHRRLVGGVAER